MPPGVINMLPGDGLDVSKVALSHPDLAGIHFTGSTPTFQHLWREVGENIANYRAYPRIVGETGGKDFIVAHPSADPDVTRVAMIRGAFEFQGQKCSAASRAYVARSVWKQAARRVPRRGRGARRWATSPTSPTSWARSSTTGRSPSTRRRSPGPSGTKHLDVLAGGQVDDSVGYFVRPTVVESTDPTDQMFSTEYFGPILAVHVYEDGDFEKVVAQMESFAPYALTGAIIAQDRRAIAWAQRGAALRGRQLLHQRQADRRGRRPAAVRRRPGLRHQRQGRRRGQPAALDQPAHHQGDVRAAEGLPLPVHGLSPRVRPMLRRRGSGSPV